MRIIYLIDFNCPHSYIGFERIKKASRNLDLDAVWEMRSFELEPRAGKNPEVSTAERYSEKYGLSYDDALSKISQIEKTALEDGLEINFRDMPLTSSNDALRLCKFAQSRDSNLTLKLVGEIFRSRFCLNENIADVNVLKKIATSCGFEKSDVKKILENDYYNIECFLDMEEAVSNGITATPCFILIKKEEKLIIPGAFTTEEFETALKDFAEGNIKSKTYGFGTL